MRIEDVYDLNEQNVGKFLQYCRANSNDSKDDIYKAFSFLLDDGKVNPNTTMPISRPRYERQRERIASMLGQLKKIHDNNKTHETSTYYLDTIDLQTKYDGTRWTQDPNYTLFLYILGNAGYYFAGLRKGSDGVYRTSLHQAFEVIEPMESPNDPKLVKRFPNGLYWTYGLFK